MANTLPVGVSKDQRWQVTVQTHMVKSHTGAQADIGAPMRGHLRTPREQAEDSAAVDMT